MSFTRSIIFNDITATISFPTTLNSNNQLDWTIALTSGTNKVCTIGTVNIDVATPEPNIAEPIAPPNSATIPSTYLEDEKMKHVTAIKAMLIDCDVTKGTENKAAIAIKLLDYVSGEALEFTNSHERFKNAVISKCYEFKQVNADMTDVVKKADETLTVLGASTTIPADFKASDMSIAAVPATVPAAAPKPAEKEDAPTMDLALFTVIAKKYNNKNVMANLKQYLRYFENAVRCNAHFTKGSTKAEKMTNYLNNLSDDGQRITLMKEIFKKHNLVFNDVAMDLYSDWVNTCKPTGKTNRYTKMKEFATIHKSLFTA